jgi:hypothetical protein
VFYNDETEDWMCREAVYTNIAIITHDVIIASGLLHVLVFFKPEIFILLFSSLYAGHL